jgi:hypothetical protein
MTLKQFLLSPVGFSTVFLTVIMPLLTFTGVGLALYFMFRRWKQKLFGRAVCPTNDRVVMRLDSLGSPSSEQSIFSS